MLGVNEASGSLDTSDMGRDGASSKEKTGEGVEEGG